MSVALKHRLYFLRHGETDWNVAGRLQGQRDVPLNGRGRDQATAAGHILWTLFAPSAFLAAGWEEAGPLSKLAIAPRATFAPNKMAYAF